MLNLQTQTAAPHNLWFGYAEADLVQTRVYAICIARSLWLHPPASLMDNFWSLVIIRHSDIYPPSGHKMGWEGASHGSFIPIRAPSLWVFTLRFTVFNASFYVFNGLQSWSLNNNTKTKILTGNHCLNESKERYGHFSRKLTTLYSNIHTLKQEIMIILIKSIMSYCRPINTWSFLLTTPALGHCKQNADEKHYAS